MSTEHRPILTPLMGPRYGDDESIPGADWDGTTELSCSCGWRDSRISASGLDGLAGRWRTHLTANTYGLPLRDNPAH
ncbi:MAG: hypothetical protein M3256_26260 [Actinomycetota bacterium]|jgi:hypothetical protein|nr:hypothetical protein [Actinomycetota bacterium]